MSDTADMPSASWRVAGGLVGVGYPVAVAAAWWFADLPETCQGEGPGHRPTFAQLISCSPDLWFGDAVSRLLLVLLLLMPTTIIAALIYGQVRKRRRA